MRSEFKIHNATELWQKETSLPSIPTFSRALDSLFGTDGVKLGSITELIGLPGSGKTQLCLQLCASTQVPKILGGLCAEAVYIDTNTNFTISRFKEILSASLLRCQRLLGNLEIKEDDALKKLHYVKAIGLEKFCAFMYRLPKFIVEHPNIKLIVIDSIAFPFKEGVTPKQRTALLFRQMAELQKLALDKQIAVVLTNEMSTRLGLADADGCVVGALGDAWAHRCNTRLLLGARHTHQSAPDALDTPHTPDRVALLLKSNEAPNAVATFRITREGIRDTNENTT